MTDKVWKVKDRVALKEDNKYRGSIYQVQNISDFNGSRDPPMYYVQWDNGDGSFLYVYEALISEKEVEEIKPKSKGK